MASPENLRAAGLMTAGMAAFAFSDACMKGLGPHMPLFQAMTLRGAGVSVVLLALLALRAPGAWRAAGPRDRRLMGLRAVAEMVCAWTYLSALLLMPLANVSAIFQALPLAVTLAGALILGERVGPGRWAAILVGFGGVLLIVRPGGEGFGWASGLVLASVACVTARDILSRAIAPNVPSLLVAVVTSLGVTGFAAVGSGFVDWAPVSPQAGAMLGGAMAFLVVGYLAVVAAMRRGEIAFVAPFRYASLVVSIVLGAAMFGTVPDPLTALGAAVVVGSGLYTLMAEGRAGRRAVGRAAAVDTPP